MSTRRSPSRQAFYETPEWCVTAFLREAGLPPGGSWLEPCAGRGAIIRAANAYFDGIHGTHPAWAACEIREELADDLRRVAPSAVVGDFLEVGDLPHYDVAIMNPPFDLAAEFVNACLPIAGRTILLQRLNFLGSVERAPFWRVHAADVYVLVPRPSFTGKGSDATEYAWFVWHGTSRRGLGTIRVLEPRQSGIRRGTPVGDKEDDR